MRVEIRIAKRHRKLHTVRARHCPGPRSDKGDFVFLLCGKDRIRFREHVEGACNIERLHTIEYNNGDFHAVTFVELIGPIPIPAIR